MKLPSALSNEAKKLAISMGAEAVVIIAVLPNAAGDGWDAEHSGYLQKDTGLDWSLVARVVADASEDLVTEPAIEDPAPS